MSGIEEKIAWSGEAPFHAILFLHGRGRCCIISEMIFYCSITGCSAVGSAGGLGPSGRGFEPLHSDQKSTVILIELRWTQSVKEVSQICELFGIIGEKENRRGKKNGTVAAG